jgi:hypothetical protein
MAFRLAPAAVDQLHVGAAAVGVEVNVQLKACIEVDEAR